MSDQRAKFCPRCRRPVLDHPWSEFASSDPEVWEWECGTCAEPARAVAPVALGRRVGRRDAALRGSGMNPAWRDLQAACDVLCARWQANQTIDLTTTGCIDVRDEHDPVSGQVLGEVA